MKYILLPTLLLSGLFLFSNHQTDGKITKTITIDSLGACQGISHQQGKYFLYGDREVGVMREYILGQDSLIDQHKEYRFTIGGRQIH
jgi:hypothetical protein